jgi:hypothetical protein
MRKKTLLFLTLFLTLQMQAGQAQNVLQLDPPAHDTTFSNLDISDEWMEIPIPGFMSNTTSDTVDVYWERFFGNCTEEWGIAMFDKNITYVPGVNMSWDPVRLLPFEEDAFFYAFVRPQSTPGCCDFSVIFSNWDDRDIIYDTLQFTIRINDDLCLTTSVESAASKVEQFRISPNPVSTSLMLETALTYDRIVVYDSFGRQVLMNRKNLTNSYDLAHLTSGIYWLTLLNNDRIVTTAKVVKW